MLGVLAALTVGSACATPRGEAELAFSDPGAQQRALQHALTMAATGTDTQDLNIGDLVWLATMSDRLAQRIPNPLYRVRLLKIILNEARANGLDPQLVLAVIDVESSFNRDAVSKSGAIGLMQVMPFWQEVYDMPDADLSNPLVSVRFGCNILRHYMDRYDNVRNALAAYNGSLGFSTYPDRVIARYRKNWQYAANKQDALSLAANTRIKAPEHSTFSTTLGALELPPSQAALTLRPAPTVVEFSEPTLSVPTDSVPTAALEAEQFGHNAVASTAFE